MCNRNTSFGQRAFIDTQCTICLQQAGSIFIFSCGHGVCPECYPGLIRTRAVRESGLIHTRVVRELVVVEPVVVEPVVIEPAVEPVIAEPVGELVVTEPVGEPANIVPVVDVRFNDPRPPWRTQWTTFPHPSFHFGEREVMWVFCAFSFSDWTLIDINTGFPWKGYVTPPSPPNAGPVRWIRNSRNARWSAQ